MANKINYLEEVNSDGTIIKSNSRRTIYIAAIICVLAALTESATQILTALDDGELARADWYSIAALCGVLLVGTGVVKTAQNTNIKLGGNDTNSQ